MACGLAMLVPSFEGIKEVVKEGDSGLMFHPDNAMAFKIQLMMLVNSQPLRTRMGQQAAKDAEQYFDMDKVSSQLVACLTEEYECRLRIELLLSGKR
jgi:glycosyltransferase involved in cell wall biosynthesis